MREPAISKSTTTTLVIALLAALALLGWREAVNQRSSKELDTQVHKLTQRVEALTEEAGVSRGRLEFARSDALRSGSPEVLAALVAQKLEQAQRHSAPAEETATNDPKAPDKLDPVALAAANDVVDAAIQSGRWDRQHQLELSEKLAALHSESEARDVAARVAAAINHGQLIPTSPEAREN